MIYIKIYLLVWFWCEFEPLQDKIDQFFENKEGMIWEYIYRLIQCQYCLNLWITLILTGNIFVAIFSSMVAQLHKKIIK